MSAETRGEPDVAALMGGPLLEEIAAPILGGLLAAGLPLELAVIREAAAGALDLRAECRRLEPVPGDEDGEAPSRPCPECGAIEHQLQFRPGEYVCGACNHNYAEGA